MSDIDQSISLPHHCTLELLGPELQRHILLEATTLNQVHNLINASPRFYQVFLFNKQFILSTMARRHFHPTVLSEALTFARISQLKQPFSRETVKACCDINLSTMHEGQHRVTPISESTALCKLASNLKFFIEDYARNTLPIMDGLGASSDLVTGHDLMPEYWPEKPVSYSELSETEIGRLQRAFCRFEIYRKLFAQCSTELDHHVEECASEPAVIPEEQADMYLGKLPDYQIAEINCIRDYLIRRLRGICTQLEEEAVKTVSPETFVFDQNGDTETDQWNSGFFLFTKSGKHEQGAHLEHLMSLGLPYIRRIFDSVGHERRDLFIRDTGCCVIRHLQPGNFLTWALDCLGRNPAWVELRSASEPESSWEFEAKPDIELNCPADWSWANPRGPPINLHDENFKGLRDWGYVFWDFDRLYKSGILERDSNEILVNEFDEYGASRGPSVQERLLNPLSIWYLGADWEYPSEEWEEWTDIAHRS